VSLTPEVTTADEVPRRAVVRLVRFGFHDGARAARLLSDQAHPHVQEAWAPFAGRFADLVRARAATAA